MNGAWLPLLLLLLLLQKWGCCAWVGVPQVAIALLLPAPLVIALITIAILLQASRGSSLQRASRR